MTSVTNVDMRMKVLNFPKHVVYTQVIFHDIMRCLVSVNGFQRGCKDSDNPVIAHSFYVPKRGVEGGVAWDIDVIPTIQTLVESIER